MCSWCWAFRPVRTAIRARLPSAIPPQRVLGGLATDTREPMPEALRTYIQDTWRRIECSVPGTKFNFEFWSRCRPRRSTYPPCRAVIAATAQGPHFEEPMIEAIQRAYYLEAQKPLGRRNPDRAGGRDRSRPRALRAGPDRPRDPGGAPPTDRIPRAARRTRFPEPFSGG
jgi:hypothetical protein